MKLIVTGALGPAVDDYTDYTALLLLISVSDISASNQTIPLNSIPLGHVPWNIDSFFRHYSCDSCDELYILNFIVIVAL